MRIRYRAVCITCKLWIDPPNGFLHRFNGKWFAHCLDCHDKKESNQHKGDVKNRLLKRITDEMEEEDDEWK